MKYSVLSLFLLVDIVSLAHGKTPHENKDEDETCLTSSSSALEVKFNFESGTLGRWKVVAGEFGDLVTGRKFFLKEIPIPWNEIYEDGYLQPDVKYGYEYMKRIKTAFK